jgi:histidinol-phosphatase (PHP family)
MTGLFNFHTHSYYCDGSDEPEAYVKAAIRAGFHSLGFSSHAPVPFANSFAIQDEEHLENYCLSVQSLEKKYAGHIRIFLGLEIDYIKGISSNFNDFRGKYGLDYVIGSVHLVRRGSDRDLWFIDGPKTESYDRGLLQVFGGDIRKAVGTFYAQTNQMLLVEKPDIVGHLDKVKMHNNDRYFSEEEPWYRSLVMETLSLARQTGVIVEVNTRGIYKGRCHDTYPGVWILQEVLRMKIPVTLSSDAHRPEEIDGQYPETLKILKDIGFRAIWFLGRSGWEEQPLQGLYTIK